MEKISKTASIYIHEFETPIGTMCAGATEEKLCLLEFTDRKMLDRQFIDLQNRLSASIIYDRNEITGLTENQIAEYFRKERTDFSIPLLTSGSDFQNRVWDELNKIPIGETRSYAQQAVLLGNPRAIRAVANANGMNRIAIIIPCHRVIGADGSFTGYAWGLSRKKWLLMHEGAYGQELTLF